MTPGEAGLVAGIVTVATAGLRVAEYAIKRWNGKNDGGSFTEVDRRDLQELLEFSKDQADAIREQTEVMRDMRSSLKIMAGILEAAFPRRVPSA